MDAAAHTVQVDAVVDRQVGGFSAAGTWFDGAQRAAIVAAARASVVRGAAAGGADAARTASATSTGAADGAAAPPPSIDAARRIAAAPATVTQGWVDALEARGLDAPAYVEVVGIVARLAAIDAWAWGLGRPPPTVPPPVPGAPTRATVADARRRSAWVPIAGGARATTTLSAVAAESRDRAVLSGVLYLTDDRVGTADEGGGDIGPLRRAQVEVVAARVSHRNDCFY